ncbi:MAG TPA: hypothetical protein VFT59_03450 [Candidatus Saccharimonadales bacterium]|nr:hypothetical protein [Candidatus Saccharimonadales bacterium]
METGKFEEQVSPINHETLELAETSIEQLPERLGFIESEELVSLRREILKVMATDREAAVKKLIGQYLLIGQRIVEEHQGDEFAKAQIGLSIKVSLIRREAERIGDYLLDLEDALVYASCMGFDDIITAIRGAMDQEIGRSH